MTFPLARDQQGNPLTIPPEAAYWRVRRHTGGRPSTVLGPDGEPLFIGITSDRAELQAYGCNGSIRLEAVDSDYRTVRSPVAFVEMGVAGTVEGPRPSDSSDNPELVRASMESLTRTMEAMQRSQTEHERGISQREKAITDAQIEMQRSHSELILALMDKVTGGKPQDPLTVLQESVKFQKALESATGKPRNAGALLVSTDPEATEASTGQTVAKWVGMLAPLVPHCGEAFANAANDPAKATEIRRNAAVIGNLMGSFAGMAGGPAPAPAAMNWPAQTVVIDAQPQAGVEDDDEGVVDIAVEESDDDEDRTPSKAIRQVLAMLDDDEAADLMRFINALDGAEFDDLERAADSISSSDERLAWARGLTFGLAAQGDEEDATHEPAEVAPRKRVATSATVNAAPSNVTAPPVSGLSIPPVLFPVLAQLSPDEQMMGAQILQALDMATIERLTAELVALPSDRALAKVRRMIANAQQRAASIAQRAVMAVLHEETEANGTNGGAA